LRILVEIGRFVVTALAVGLAIPTFFAMISLFSSGSMGTEAFVGIGAISYVLGSVGGIVFGLPALWFSKRHQWDRDLRKLAAVGVAVGSVGGALLSVLFWAGNLDIIIPGLVQWTVMGATAGLVSACVWFWLHSGDEEIVHA